jgi:ribose transport system permease protein
VTTTTTASHQRKDDRSLADRLASVDQGVIVAGLLAVLCAVFALTLNRFATAGNANAIASATAGLGVLALAQAVVVIGRGLDLSIIAVYGVTGQLVANRLNAGHGEVETLLIGLAAALGLGLFNGVLVAYLEVPPLFVTLATSLLFIGAARLLFFGGKLLFGMPESAGLVTDLGQGKALGLPVSLFVWVGLALLAWRWSRQTTTGRMVYAVGDNVAAARMTGMPARPITVLTYLISASLAFVGGLIIISSAGQFDGRTITAGSQLYDVIAIVVIGGVSLAGGRGSILGVVAATVLIGVILNGMTLLNFDSIQQSLFKSLIVLGALVLDRWLHPPDEETARTGEL